MTRTRAIGRVLAAALIGGAFAVGCTNRPATPAGADEWVKDGTTPVQRNADIRACTRQGTEPGWVGWRGRTVMLPVDVIDPDCMTRRGYRRPDR